MNKDIQEQNREGVTGEQATMSDLTELIREADRMFETVGGSTRHYVRDCLLPLMEQKGMKLINSKASTPQNREGVIGDERKMKLNKFWKVIENTPPEVRQAVKDMMAELDAQHSPSTPHREQPLTEEEIEKMAEDSRHVREWSNNGEDLCAEAMDMKRSFILGYKAALQYNKEGLGSQQGKVEAVEGYLRKRIKELNDADAAFCDQRWPNDKLSVHPLVKQLAREKSNEVTFARQELETVLALFKTSTSGEEK